MAVGHAPLNRVPFGPDDPVMIVGVGPITFCAPSAGRRRGCGCDHSGLDDLEKSDDELRAGRKMKIFVDI
jgi:hypothetical protein